MSAVEATELSLIGWPLTGPVYDSKVDCYKATLLYKAARSRRLPKKIRKATKRLKRRRSDFAAVKISHVNALDGETLITVQLLVVSEKFDHNTELIGRVIEEAFAK